MSSYPARQRGIPFWLNLLVLIAATVLTVFAVEVGVRLLAPTPFAAEYNLYYVPDPHTGFRPLANSVGVFSSGSVGYVNSHSQRSDDVTLEKPPKTFRVLVLGDSYTMGTNVDQNETYSSVLQRLLRERLPYPVEVINAGVGAWCPFQYAQYLEHYGMPFDPDLVVLGFFVGNDTYHPASSVEQTRTAVGGRRVKRADSGNVRWRTMIRIFLYEHSHIFRRITNRDAFVIRNEEFIDKEQPRDTDEVSRNSLNIQKMRLHRNHRPQTSQSAKEFKNNLSQVIRIRDIAQRGGIPFVAALIPEEIQVNRTLAQRLMLPGEEYDLSMPQKMLIQEFERHGIRTLDLLPAFQEHKLRLYLNDGHWSARGHALAANLLLEEVLNWVTPTFERTMRPELPN